jgi:3-oxoacyl-[acyl-carrier protein] reductase
MALSGLKQKKALVTGAASGIGQSVVRRLAAEGVEVIGTDIHPAEHLIPADLTDPAEVRMLGERVRDIDFLVNVAGGPVAPSHANTLPPLPSGALPFEDIEFHQWNDVLAANLSTAFLMCREFAPRMKTRRFGRIVNFTSIAARRGSDRVGVHYAAAKAGIIGLTKSLALELGPHGITVNAIAPGFISTERMEQASWGRQSPEAHRAFIASIPLRRVGKPDDVAGVVAILCSDAGGYVSGATLDVNGGLYFGP